MTTWRRPGPLGLWLDDFEFGSAPEVPGCPVRNLHGPSAVIFPVGAAVAYHVRQKPAAAVSGVAGSISGNQLLKIFANADADYLGKVADELNTNLARYGLDSVLRRSHFFGQLRQEAGPRLKAAVESLNYSPAGLKGTFKYYQNHPQEADADGRVVDQKTHVVRAVDQPLVANKVYANNMHNGAAASGDGWKFRGRGLIQVTGRDNYGAVTARYKDLYSPAADFVASPDLMKDFPYSVRSAVCFWIMKGLPKVADRGDTKADVDAVTQIVNKNTDSYAQRRQYFRLAYDAFK
jgi:putative chitinase